ncbi:MAG: heme ABC exporter ATP-binding protein CcmA [Candidatus Dormibacteraeota bacterium]|nr:heme ABC exporter ATP-binding protein CcmA [Candidatus Dormibacteraeota bacterium]
MERRAAVLGRGLVQRFGRVAALGPLDLDLSQGERLAVLGDNGAGKTTLLRLLATLARPVAGNLHVLGFDSDRERDRIRPRLGYLGHKPALYPALTVRENLEFFATLHGASAAVVPAALEEAGLSALSRVRLEELSRGQAQRVALIRAVLHEPELLVLDEPDASLDGPGRILLARVLEGRTAIIATHDRPLARKLCGVGLLLRAGRVAGDPWALRVVGGG